MIIGVPKEVKESEYRVGLVPSGVKALVTGGHEVIVESHAGEGSGIKDEDYQKEGAKIASSAREVYQVADMIIKVKEPMPEEWNLLKEGEFYSILYSFMEIDCNRKTFTNTYAIEKKKDGEVVWKGHIPAKPNMPIPPDSLIQNEYELVCIN
ncbi:MAG: hypothetical protein HYW01_03885 [Deltaproteobacteria bacterium]|nr:hypothetical protein [Deltaproteobacteria bacterium]